MPNSLKVDVKKVVKSKSTVKKDVTPKLKGPQVLKYSRESTAKSSKTVDETTGDDVEKEND